MRTAREVIAEAIPLQDEQIRYNVTSRVLSNLRAEGLVIVAEADVEAVVAYLVTRTETFAADAWDTDDTKAWSDRNHAAMVANNRAEDVLLVPEFRNRLDAALAAGGTDGH